MTSETLITISTSISTTELMEACCIGIDGVLHTYTS